MSEVGMEDKPTASSVGKNGESVSTNGNGSNKEEKSWRTQPLLHFRDLTMATQSRKARFTCVDASENFVACGTNNGSVYLYATSQARTGHQAKSAQATGISTKYRLVKVITPPSNDRVGVSCVTISPNQKHLVVGTSRGVVYALQLSDYQKIGEKIEFSHDFHAGFPITCFLWDSKGHRLFSACNAGTVCQTVLRAGVSALFGSTDTELLLKEETGIVQLDLGKQGKQHILLVSSQLRVLLLNMSSGDGSAVQVGTKARQGSYGACFFTNYDPEAIDPTKKVEAKVFSARPGRRVWIADPMSGKVSSTLKFPVNKQPSSFPQETGCAFEGNVQTRDLSINRVSLFHFIHEPYVSEPLRKRTLLLSWSPGSTVLFLLDPIAVEIVEWHLDLGVIHDLKVLNDKVFVALHGEPPRVSMVQSCTAQQFLDTYAKGDVRKSVELALEYQMNDVLVLEQLQHQWSKLTEDQPEEEKDDDAENMTNHLDSLLTHARELEDRHQSDEYSNVHSIEPLQIVYKQRPQSTASIDLPSVDESEISSLHVSPSSTDAAVTLATGKHHLHKQNEYSDVLAPSFTSSSKSILTPDGSNVQARTVQVPFHTKGDPIVREEDREMFMAEIMARVKHFEEVQEMDQSNMNRLSSRLKDSLNPDIAARAFSTFLPSTSMLNNIIDTSTRFGRGQFTSVFGETEDVEDDVLLDPVPPHMYSYGWKIDENGDEYPVLRIAMSSSGQDNRVDTEVLLEAIATDLWDTHKKYESFFSSVEEDEPDNFDLPDLFQENEEEALTTRASSTASVMQVSVQDTHAKDSSESKKSGHYHSSPEYKKNSQNALKRYLHATASSEVKTQSMVSGQLATTPDLAPLLKRDANDLAAELQSAALTAEKTKHLTQRLWPAAGITRVCACLTNLFLLQGDMKRVLSTIGSWLSCFDPTASAEDVLSQHSDDATDLSSDASTSGGFAKGEALVGGDGLPLTRGDWNLVRALVSTYFVVFAAGDKLHIRPAPKDGVVKTSRGMAFAVEMGAVMHLEEEYDWSTRGERESRQVCTADEAEEFVNKYGAYLNPELAAEVCSLRYFPDALQKLLDNVMANANMAEIGDDMVNSIAEGDVAGAMQHVEESESLCLLLHHLDLLLKKCPVEAVEVCCHQYPVVYPWNVERCLFGSRLTGDKEDWRTLKDPQLKDQVHTYIRYLVRLLEVKGEQAGQDRMVVDRCLKLCFSDKLIVRHLFEEEGRRGKEKWVTSLLAQPELFLFDHESVWKSCHEHGMASGMTELMLQSLRVDCTQDRGKKELSQLAAFYLRKRELDMLERLCLKLTWTPSCISDLMRIVLERVMEHIDRGLEWEQKLVSSTLFNVFKVLESSQAIALLEEFQDLVKRVPLTLLQSIAHAAALEDRRKSEVHQMLEVVDSSVWKSYRDATGAKGMALPPQVTGVMELEMGIRQPSLDDDQFEEWKDVVEEQKKLSLKDEMSHGGGVGQRRKRSSSTEATPGQSLIKRSYEYRNSEWGGEVELHDSTCAWCELPVVLITHDNESMEVVVLPCGHAFHALCLQDESCSICLDANLTTLCTN